MFTRVNGNIYTLDKDIGDNVYRECSEIVRNGINDDIMEDRIIIRSIKELIAVRVAGLVTANLKETVISNGFIVVKFASDVTLDISVGYLSDKFVYGILIK